MNALARTALIVTTIVTVCFAVLQVASRIAFWQLPRLEAAINAALASQGIAMHGLEGRWNGINPGLYADRITFPAGEAIGIDAELDVLESLGRNRIVARRLTIADSRIAFDKTPTGWRLRGATGPSDFDLAALLTHSDQVWLRGRIGLHDPIGRGELHVESMLINQDGNHRFHLGIRTGASCADCMLTIEGDIDEDGPGTLHVVGESVVLGAGLLDAGGLGAVFARGADKRMKVDVAGDWRRAADGTEHGRLQLASQIDGLPGASARLGIEASVWRDGEAGYRGRIESASLASGDANFLLSGGGFAIRPSRVDGAVWLAELQVEALARPLAQAFGAEHIVGRYVERLRPRARIEALGIHVDGQGLAFHGSASEASITGHKGVPEVANATLAFGGSRRSARFRFDSRDVLLAFPDYLDAYATYEGGSGVVTVARGDGYVGARGTAIAVRHGGTRAEGGFALARRIGGTHTDVVVDGHVDQVDVGTARDYVPNTLDPGLRAWLLTSVQAGHLTATRMVYQGRTTTSDELPRRRFEMVSRVADATVSYQPEWPIATGASGQLRVTAGATEMRGEAYAFGVRFPEVDVRIPRRTATAPSEAASTALVTLRCDTSLARLLAFARATPVREALPFLSDAWTGAGPVRVDATLRMPLDERPLRPGDISADFRFGRADLHLADIGLRFENVRRQVHFEFPAELTSDGLEASLFGVPVAIGIASDADTVRFNVTGMATPQDAYRLLDIEDPGIADGRFRYDAELTVFPATDRAMELSVTSDLAGLAVRLPPPLAKTPDETRPLTAAMQFLDDHVAVAARYGDADGWLHTADGGIRAGAIGIGSSVPMIDAAEGRVVLGGGVAEIDSETMETLLAPAAGVDRPFAWELRRFAVGRMALDALEITDAVLDGFSERGEVSFAVEAAELSGTVAKSGDAPWHVKLAELRLPPSASDGDPVTATAIDRLLAADVELDRVFVGDEDYGSWRLGIRPDAGGVALTDVVADVRGLHIESDGDVYWSRAGETRFAGVVRAANLYEVLPLWGFAPSVESEAFQAAGQVRWPGSPLNFDLAHLSGDAKLRLGNGRFLDVAQGATPILSLINFSTIAKRMSLDFSDVFGAGVSFDTVLAELTVDDGLARFTKAAEIVGTGSSFRVAGSVDLDSGALDNEMVVTLPLHSSLPWYAVAVLLSNPASAATAAAVVLGRQVFKDQLRRLTSGKYRIRGTYDEPEVEFVGIFVDDVEVVPDAGLGEPPDDTTALPGAPTRTAQTPPSQPSG